jgi:hypothetical protein
VEADEESDANNDDPQDPHDPKPDENSEAQDKLI